MYTKATERKRVRASETEHCHRVGQKHVPHRKCHWNREQKG